ncbi:right-handed parallel beta-helix repeat-containing protein [Pedobacter hartonius]|uniref:Right handed beta helix region n=1 Tax=Pedobacter hartonius TaxID=425514 RepID=A0A1H4E754_9SPHI|nr:right-handed parallel beta-helix repeat-containing protein [Pedobacter hartonius]SEA80904.1 Right handed beta helix region [Pedobacter hartonius]
MKTNYKKVARLLMAGAFLFQFTLLSACRKDSAVKTDDMLSANAKGSAISNVNAATTYYLAANSNSADFQALVNSAVDGDVIILRTGSHYVTTGIRLPAGKNGIVIRGEAGAVIRKATNTSPVAAITITGNYNTIDQIELDGGDLPEAGIILYGQHNTISNSKIHNCGNATARGAGILIHNLGTPVCAFNSVIGCSVYYNYMVGVSQNGHSGGTIKNNNIYESGAEGLTIDILSHNCYVYGNTIDKNNKYNRGVGGIGIDDSNGSKVDQNTVSNTYYRSGITFQNNIGGCDGAVISNNHLTNNTAYGILERYTNYQNTNKSFTGNIFSGNVANTFIQY